MQNTFNNRAAGFSVSIRLFLPTFAISMLNLTFPQNALGSGPHSDLFCMPNIFIHLHTCKLRLHIWIDII